MLEEKHVNTRELLRNFRKYKEMLQAGKIHVVHISVDDGQGLQLFAEGKRGNAVEIVERIRALKKPIRIKRNPKLFNTLIRPEHWPS